MNGNTKWVFGLLATIIATMLISWVSLGGSARVRDHETIQQNAARLEDHEDRLRMMEAAYIRAAQELEHTNVLLKEIKDEIRTR